MKILMVVDQPEIWESHIAILTFFHKHTVDIVTDTDLALQALRKSLYDLMITDEYLASGKNDPLKGTCTSDYERGFRFLRFIDSWNQHAVKRAILIAATCFPISDENIAACRIPIRQMRIPVTSDVLLAAVESGA